MNDETYQAMLREVAERVAEREDRQPGEATAREMMAQLQPPMTYRQFTYLLDGMVERGELLSRMGKIDGLHVRLYRRPEGEE